jgi:hypothetical protein
VLPHDVGMHVARGHAIFLSEPPPKSSCVQGCAGTNHMVCGKPRPFPSGVGHDVDRIRTNQENSARIVLESVTFQFIWKFLRRGCDLLQKFPIPIRAQAYFSDICLSDDNQRSWCPYSSRLPQTQREYCSSWIRFHEANATTVLFSYPTSQRVSPKPVPVGFPAVTNGSNNVLRIEAGMPGPLSRIVT